MRGRCDRALRALTFQHVLRQGFVQVWPQLEAGILPIDCDPPDVQRGVGMQACKQGTVSGHSQPGHGQRWAGRGTHQ
jgi:hypothetical protein